MTDVSVDLSEYTGPAVEINSGSGRTEFVEYAVEHTCVGCTVPDPIESWTSSRAEAEWHLAVLMTLGSKRLVQRTVWAGPWREVDTDELDH